MKQNILDIRERYSSGSWQEQELDFRRKLIPLAFRFFALLVALIHIKFFLPASDFVIDPYFLLLVAALDALFIAGLPFIIHPLRIPFLSPIRCAIDLTTCFWLVLYSGGAGSPFILYALAPPLTAALIFKKKITFVVSAITCLAVVISQIFNPFYLFQISTLSISHLTIVITAVALTASLPYMVNTSLKKRLEEEQVRLERQRLSREIHDGVAQTLHALCWQVQRVRHHLDLASADDYDVEKLEKLADKARRDILQALEILRSRSGESDLQTILRDCLEDFKGDSNIDFSLKAESGDIDLESGVKKELASICREALANIKKHAGAHSVQVNLKRENGHLELSIVDDGCGFDAVSYNRNGLKNGGHHGLSMMNERARLMNGKLSILSLPERGTEVRVEVPCSGRRGRERQQ